MGLLRGRWTQIIQDVSLTTGSNMIAHALGRNLIGWYIVRVDGPATIHDSQTTNMTPDKTLILNSSANVTISLWVF